MPPNQQQPATKTPLVILAALLMLFVATLASIYEIVLFTSVVNDATTGIIAGVAKIFAVVTAMSILLLKRPQVYVLALIITLEAVFIGFAILGYKITMSDALIIGALFLAVIYYRGFFEKQTTG